MPNKGRISRPPENSPSAFRITHPPKNGLFVIMSSVKFATLNKNQLGAGAFFPKEFFQVAVSRGDVMH